MMFGKNLKAEWLEEPVPFELSLRTTVIRRFVGSYRGRRRIVEVTRRQVEAARGQAEAWADIDARIRAADADLTRPPPLKFFRPGRTRTRLFPVAVCR